MNPSPSKLQLEPIAWLHFMAALIETTPRQYGSEASTQT
ncbi:hypothetical protein thalar_00583 [Litoreibacter arenae DSM 19593]|uniref:Mobile element protein n=1 Tax=Litoreibacter arenae DSM 19593 TaxID=1123360 RepID=S9S4R4_9RHOB|nr:hypothetical protein thalar_00583 [Litoreibacter arenae DSM 19593]